MPDTTTPTPAAAWSPEREQEIRARVGAATPGTWGTHYDGAVYHLAADIRLTGAGVTCGRVIARLADGDGDAQQVYADASFIRHARADVEAVLAELDRTRAEQNEAVATVAEQAQRLAVREREHNADRAELERLRARVAELVEQRDDALVDLAGLGAAGVDVTEAGESA